MNDYYQSGVGGSVTLTGSQNKWLLLIGAAIIIYLIYKKSA
jgi:hypothetical protein